MKRKRIKCGFASHATPATESRKADREYSIKLKNWLLEDNHQRFVEPAIIVHEAVIVHALKDLDKVYPYAKGANERAKEATSKNPFKEKVVSETVTIKVLGKEITISREEYEQHNTL